MEVLTASPEGVRLLAQGVSPPSYTHLAKGCPRPRARRAAHLASCQNGWLTNKE
jgi:hypothetical protein